MSHAEAVHTLQPAAGATDQIVRFAGSLRYDALPEDARHYARRHLLDTVGVMIAGAGGTIATQAENVIKAVRPAGKIPVPGRARRADLLDAAFLGGTAAHGIELDDGYRHGSAHCGCVVIPAVLSVAYDRHASGRALIEAIVAGYETNICLARACAPDLRQRGFHPTSAVGPFGAAMATAKLRGLNAQQFANALGIAASSAAGPVRLRRRRRRHQAAARRPRLARGHAGGAARRARHRRPAERDRGPRRLHAGLRLRPHRQGAADHAAARGRVRHHRLLHQALCVLPPHPAGGRGDVPAAQRREDRVRGHHARSRSRPTRSRPSTPMCRGTISPARS